MAKVTLTTDKSKESTYLTSRIEGVNVKTITSGNEALCVGYKPGWKTDLSITSYGYGTKLEDSFIDTLKKYLKENLNIKFKEMFNGRNKIIEGVVTLDGEEIAKDNFVTYSY